MARRFTLQILMDLASQIGANPAKAVSRSNISFLGKGPTKNPLFQNRLAGLENATQANLGKPETLFGAIEDAIGWAKDGKLNSIQTEILGHNLSGINKILNPPPLPMASVTPIVKGLPALERVIRTRFPKESHRFFGRPLKDKDFSEIDRMVMEGKIPDARGRTWDLKVPGTAVDASGLKLAKPSKESSRSFLEMMADRGHKVLKPGTPEYEAYMKKGLRTFPGGRLPETGPGVFNKALNQKTGMFRAIARQILQQDTRLKLKPEELYSLRTGKGEPLDLMRKYYGKSMLNLDAWLDDFLPRTTLPPRDLASRVLNEVELIPQFASGGLARILEL